MARRIYNFVAQNSDVPTLTTAIYIYIQGGTKTWKVGCFLLFLTSIKCCQLLISKISLFIDFIHLTYFRQFFLQWRQFLKIQYVMFTWFSFSRWRHYFAQLTTVKWQMSLDVKMLLVSVSKIIQRNRGVLNTGMWAIEQDLFWATLYHLRSSLFIQKMNYFTETLQINTSTHIGENKAT